MAKLHFYYSTMNAGKTTTLLQANHNYRERGMHTFLLTPDLNKRDGEKQIKSRVGLKAPAYAFDKKENLYETVFTHHKQQSIDCIFVDEAQFLSKNQVYQLTEVVDRLNIPVLAYGLRNDFQGEPFEGSCYLLNWAESLTEIKTICHCGKKATQVLRVDQNGRPIAKGSQIEIGGNDRYVAVCRVHFKKRDTGPLFIPQMQLDIQTTQKA